MLLTTYIDDNLFSGRQTQEQPLVHNDVQIEKMRYAKITFSTDSRWWPLFNSDLILLLLIVMLTMLFLGKPRKMKYTKTGHLN